jgi:hypothetical protein
MEFQEQTTGTTVYKKDDWRCYLDRYTTKITDQPISSASSTTYSNDQAGAELHWANVGDKQGWLWGCFKGYYDVDPTAVGGKALEPATFVLDVDTGAPVTWTKVFDGECSGSEIRMYRARATIRAPTRPRVPKPVPTRA